jgi:hypothetical protein
VKEKRFEDLEYLLVSFRFHYFVIVKDNLCISKKKVVLIKKKLRQILRCHAVLSVLHDGDRDYWAEMARTLARWAGWDGLGPSSPMYNYRFSLALACIRYATRLCVGGPNLS